MFSRLAWRLLDWLDYRIWDVRLRMVDAVYGPEPETGTDRARCLLQRRCRCAEGGVISSLAPQANREFDKDREIAS